MSRAIDELKDEHETILSSLGILDKFSADVNDGLAPGRADLADFDAARSYSSLLQNHVQKENSVLFPLVEKILDPARLEGICHAFEEYQQSVIAHARHAQLHEMLRRLQHKFLK